MREERLANIVYPRWHQGLRPNHQGFPTHGYRVLAFDTETVKGWPLTLQVTDGTETLLWYLRPRQFLPRLIQWLRPHTEGHRSNVVLFGFQLGFDLVALMYPQAKRFAQSTFTLRCLDCTVTIFYGRIPFAKIRFPNRRVVWIIDAYAFAWCSLKKAAETWGLPMPKLRRPRGLGHRVLRGRAFEAYAKRDAEVTWALGGKILDLHRQFDCRLSVSIAQLAGRIFAHHYLHRTLAPTPVNVRQAALLSYHGGKNGFYLEQPRWVTCREYDLRSAYPWAMMHVPDLTAGRWEEVAYVDSMREGFYWIVGGVTRCRYPCLYDHEFKALSGETGGVWITSFECREALRAGELHLRRVRGLLWTPFRSHSGATPLARFAQTFFDLKQQAPPGPAREQYKLILNALYGKFIQLTPTADGEKPGAYFHPVLASWITGAVRARMHRLEHEMQALHTATDAIHTTRRAMTGTGLGDLELVAEGPALLLRNKVYLHFSKDGRRIKYARHGLHLPVGRFWRALVAGRRRYTLVHLLRPKEAAILGTRPLQPVKKSMAVNLEMPNGPVPWQATRFWREAR